MALTRTTWLAALAVLGLVHIGCVGPGSPRHSVAVSPSASHRAVSRPSSSAVVTPREATSELDRVARNSSTLGEAKTAPPRFVLLVRDQRYLSSLTTQTRAEITFESLVADLVVVYAIDLGSSVRTATISDLDESGLSREDREWTARRNLETLLQTPADDMTCQRGDVRVWARGNFLESSRLLSNKLWESLAAALDGRPVVAAAPAADVLVVACDPDRAAIAKLARTVEKLWQAAERPISRTLLVWSPQGWEKLR